MQTSRRLVAHFVLVFALALLLAPQLSAQEKVRRDPNVVTTEEIRTAHQRDAYDLVRSLRPRWLRPGGGISINRGSSLKVFLDGMPLGELSELRRIDATLVVEMEYLDGPAATGRYGTGHAAGAILVRTRQ